MWKKCSLAITSEQKLQCVYFVFCFFLHLVMFYSLALFPIMQCCTSFTTNHSYLKSLIFYNSIFKKVFREPSLQEAVVKKKRIIK